jgi:hypothetical protein
MAAHSDPESSTLLSEADLLNKREINNNIKFIYKKKIADIEDFIDNL